jgi:uncharacterized LabA/DUF88 family protein
MSLAVSTRLGDHLYAEPRGQDDPRLLMTTAVLVDVAFFVRRFRKIWPQSDAFDARFVANTIYETALKHLEQKIAGKPVRRDLYRVFAYDCPPILKKEHYPVTKKAIDFAKTPDAVFRLALHQELVKLRKVALRLGRLSDQTSWRLHPQAVKDLLNQKQKIEDITDRDFLYDVKQKGVDIRIGIDICSLTLKRQVDQIVLISGDADFVPAGKLARREGVDFVLDPMWSNKELT